MVKIKIMEKSTPKDKGGQRLTSSIRYRMEPRN